MGKVGYLINQYPKVSHTFVRREIKALEALGRPVARYSLRRVAEELVDEDDRREAEITRFVLDVGGPGMSAAMARVSARSPVRFAQATKLALEIAHYSERTYRAARHMIYLGEACVLLDWTAEDEVEHLHAHFGTNSTTVAMLLEVLGGPSYSFTCHGPEEFDMPGPLGLPEKIRRSRFVAGISSFGRSQLYRQVDYTQWNKVQVVRCGVDASFLDAPPVPIPEKRRLVTVGRLNEQKGQLLLLEAAARVAKEGLDFELVMVGDGELRARVEQMIEAEGLQGRVSITGWVDGARVRKELESARAFILPSFAEGLPVVIMEALALGRPVLSTYIAGIPELVTDGVNGWMVPAGSVDHLVAALRKVLTAPTDELELMGRIGRERVRAQHDIVKNAELLDRLFPA